MPLVGLASGLSARFAFLAIVATVQMHDELLTVSQAAEDLCASTQTIRNWIRSERLAAIRIGNRFLIPRAEVDRLLGDALPSQPGESPWDFDPGDALEPLPRAAKRRGELDASERVLRD
jgi:excisionase family DNA binding protein